MNKHLQQLCTPARVYIIIAILGSLLALFNRIPLLAVSTKLVFALVWTYLLNLLCSKGYKNVSWFLVLLPYVMITLGVLGFINSEKKNKSDDRK